MSTMPAPTSIAAPRPMGPGGGAPPGGGGGAGAAAIAALDPVRVLQQYYPWLIAAAVGGTIFGTVLYFALLLTFPRYTAVVRFECKPPNMVGFGKTEGGMPPNMKDELQLYMETQVQIVKSDVVFNRAVVEPSFKETGWAKSFVSGDTYDNVEALKELRKITWSYTLPETSIFVLQVRTRSKNDSAAMANAIRDVYLKDNERQATAETSGLLELATTKVKDLDSDIRQIDQSMENLLQSRQITSLEQQHSESFVEVERLQPAIVELRDAQAKATEQLKTYENLSKNPGGVVYPDAIRKEAEESRTAEELKAQLASLRARLRADRQEFGDDHQLVKREERQLKSLEDERSKLIESVMADLFNAALEQLRNSLANIQASIDELMVRLEGAKKRLNETTIALKQYKEFETTRDEKSKQKADFELRQSELSLLVQRGKRVRDISPAEPPDTPSFPNPKIVIPITAVLIVALTAGVIVLKEVREQRIRGPQDIALIPRTRAIGFVPELSMDPMAPTKIETAVREHPDGAIAESIRNIRNALLKACQAKGHKTILFASGMPGSGTSSLIANLATSAASLDLNILIIDGNLRRPTQHTIFGVAEGPGLAEVLTGKATASSVIVASGQPHISILPAGRDRKGVHERLNTPSVGALLTEMRGKYDLVLIDAPPAVVAADAIALASQAADAAVLVVRAYSEKRGLVARLRHQLGDQKAEFLGVVVNAVQASAGGYFKKNFEQTIQYQRAEGPMPTEGNKAA